MGAGLVTGLAPSPGAASSHREAPLTGADPQIDSTDLYAFVSPDKPNTVTLLSNWIPFEEPAGGPNFNAFATNVNYDINIDNDGDAVADVTYRWRFKNNYRSTDTFLYNTGQVTSLTDLDLNFYQTYNLDLITPGGTTHLLRNAMVAPVHVGKGSTPNYVQNLWLPSRLACGTDCQTFTGQTDDPFFLDLRVFDLVYGADFSEVGDDTLLGFNVHTTAIQVPIADVTAGGDGSGIIGVWTTASRPSIRVQNDQGGVSFQGKFVQISRLGNPLVNEVVVPVGSKDYFNASKPVDDAQFLAKVVDPELPHDVNAIYGLPVPDCDPSTPEITRDCDLVPVFLTGLPGLNQPPVVAPSEMLRLNTTIPPCEPGTCASYSRLGVIAGDNAGFPNGRRLADDIVDVALRVVEGILIPGHDPAADTLGDGVDDNGGKAFRTSFPYLAAPYGGSDESPHDLPNMRRI